MVEEQVIRSYPPPPSTVNDNKSTEFSDEDAKKCAFWIERVAAIIVFYCWTLNPGDFLSLAVLILITCSNVIYIVIYMNQLESGKDKNAKDRKEIQQEKAKIKPKEEVKAQDGRNKMDEEICGQEKAKVERNDKIFEENTGQKKANVKAEDERDNIDEEATGQQIAETDMVDGLKELKVSLKEFKITLKEMKEEVRRCNEKCESLEAKDLSKIKKIVELLQKNSD